MFNFWFYSGETSYNRNGIIQGTAFHHKFMISSKNSKAITKLLN